MSNVYDSVQQPVQVNPLLSRSRHVEDTAYHLAGLSLVEHMLGFPFRAITLRPPQDDRHPFFNTFGGMINQAPPNGFPEPPADRVDLECAIFRDLAGFVAEAEFRGRCDWLNIFDWHNATFRAKNFGLSDQEVITFLEAQYRRCRDTLALA